MMRYNKINSIKIINQNLIIKNKNNKKFNNNQNINNNNIINKHLKNLKMILLISFLNMILKINKNPKRINSRFIIIFNLNNNKI